MATIAGIAAIVAGVTFLIKLIAWGLIRTPEAKKEAIDRAVDSAMDQVARTGRPTDL